MVKNQRRIILFCHKTGSETVRVKNCDTRMIVTSCHVFILVSWFIKVDKPSAGSVHAGGLTRETFGVFPEMFQNIQVILLFYSVNVVLMKSPPLRLDSRWSYCMRNRAAHGSGTCKTWS